MSHMPQITEVLYEYDVVPAPKKAMRVPGLIREDDRVAHELMELFNDMALDGWEYVRADAIPIDNVTGIAGNLPATHTMLVFRRALALPAPKAQARPDALQRNDRVA